MYCQIQYDISKKIFYYYQKIFIKLNQTSMIEIKETIEKYTNFKTNIKSKNTFNKNGKYIKNYKRK